MKEWGRGREENKERSKREGGGEGQGGERSGEESSKVGTTPDVQPFRNGVQPVFSFRKVLCCEYGERERVFSEFISE